MGIYLDPNNRDFQIVLNSKIYVDKTGLIAFTNSVLLTEQRFVSVSRPRRFGKSMAANMLTAYYSCGCDSQNLFRGLKIAADDSFQEHLNKYHVIRIDMQSFLTEAEDMDDMIRMLQKAVLFDLTAAFPDVRYFDNTKLVRSLKDIYAEHDVPFVFIIDEWDCVFRQHKNDLESQKKYLDFLRNLLKDQSYVALAYITGILPVKKYGKHSALNMFYEYSMMNARPIEEFAGFTETEVQALCEQYHVSYDYMKKWYDGYTVSGLSIYNPKSVVEAIVRGAFGNYWTQTETYDALKIYIQMNKDGLKEKVECLIAGEKISVNPLKYQNDMSTFESADDVLTLLVHLGYLTAEPEAADMSCSCVHTNAGRDISNKDIGGKSIESWDVSDKDIGDKGIESWDIGGKDVGGKGIESWDINDKDIHSQNIIGSFERINCSIPNSEVRQEFINCIEDGGWENVMNAIRSSEELLQLTYARKEAEVAQRIAKVHMDNASVLQYNNEISLSCAISLAYYSAKKNYTVIREMPAGKGFADLVFVPDRNCDRPAMVVELKWDKSAKTALNQIREQKYAACLERYHGEVLLVGVNYGKDSKEHSCRIEQVKKP